MPDASVSCRVSRPMPSLGRWSSLPFNPGAFDLGVFDLDGTVLRHERGITDRTVAAVERFRAGGARIVVATGRRFEGASEHAARLGLGGTDPVICYGGSMIRRMNGETLLHRTLPLASSIEFLKWADRRGLHTRIFTDGHIAVGPDNRAARDHLRHPAGPGVFRVESPVGWLEKIADKPTKLAVAESADGVERWLGEARAAFAGRLFITRSHPFYVEVTAPESTKSRALSFLCERWNIDPERVVAFGDAENDIDMLRFAGRGVAVNPMTEQVREAADDLILTPGDDGVARYLKDLMGNTG